MVKLLSKTLPSLFLLLALVACNESSDNSQDSCTSCSEARVFNIDTSKEHFEVSVYGQTMGTPDLPTIEAFLLSDEASSYIDNVDLIATGIEGGATYCVTINDRLTRSIALNQLQLIPTDLDETLYKVESADSCE